MSGHRLDHKGRIKNWIRPFNTLIWSLVAVVSKMPTVKYNRGLLRAVAITVLALHAAYSSGRVGAVPLANGSGQSAAGPQFSVEVLVVVDQAAYLQWLGFQKGTDDEERDRQAVSAINDFVRSTLVSANLIWKVGFSVSNRRKHTHNTHRETHTHIHTRAYIYILEVGGESPQYM